jgi:acyl-CoA reductase-like NAD-dependent aldehyde dehydrogenase
MQSRGDFIGGVFLPPEGETIQSRNPARDGETVLATAGSPERIRRACEAAAEAAPAWARLSLTERLDALARFRVAIVARAEALA